jgi:phosphoglycolate phosphatase
MTMIKGLLFDKDGTLFDFAHTWEAWAYAFLLRLCDGDHEKAQTVGATIGFDLQSQTFDPDSIVIAGTAQEVTQALLPHFSTTTEAALTDVLNQEAEKAPQIEAVPLIPLLTAFREAGFKLGVATNDAERPARAHLDSAGVTDLFDFIAGYDSGFGGKPAPGQLFGFAQAVGLDPAQIAMVGDSTHDLHAGRAAGMTTIGVLTGMALEADLAPHADVVLPDIGHLPKWLAART